MSVAHIKKNRIHPYEWLMWLGLAAMAMYFAALTSAYIVKRAQAHWFIISLPKAFWVSAGIIILSSFTMHLSLNATRQQQLKKSNHYLLLTALLGAGFMTAQIQGFRYLTDNGVHMVGNVAGAFIYIIAWSHLIHVITGIAFALGIYAKQHYTQKNAFVGIKVLSIFWHFIDVLWLYLLSLLVLFR